MTRQPIHILTHAGAGLCAILALSACGNKEFNDWYTSNAYSEHAQLHFEASEDPVTGDRPLATFKLSEVTDGKVRHVNFNKTSKGYALKTPLMASDKQSTDFVISKDKEFDWFSGVKFSWNF
tara:strand:- start:322 stop:687 length:366 start_codon:yes stop_codon:yes gene_type:complete